MIKAKVIGAGGYGGVGISELLLKHPDVEIALLVDRGTAGSIYSDVYPHLRGHLDVRVAAPDSEEAAVETDVVFFATPDGVGMEQAGPQLDCGAKVIDYSGDFRFNSEQAYADYATRMGKDPVHKTPDLLPISVYGLPEIHRDKINASVNLVGNPGCFAVSCILGLAPAVDAKLIDPATLICDCKTAVSGAGKKPNPMFHYPARYDQMNAYRLSGHQHVCEIERELSLIGGSEHRVTFTAQVVPMCRGIMSVLYGQAAEGVTEATLMDVYEAYYAESPFVDVRPSTAEVGTVHVRGTNRCMLVVSVDQRTGRIRIVSHIDNLVKGQAGSALQNMNLLFDLPETAGLDQAGIYP